ncbi:MAG: hypothetical protein ACLTK0_05235 [Anaerovoracaceae bacterium]
MPQYKYLAEGEIKTIPPYLRFLCRGARVDTMPVQECTIIPARRPVSGGYGYSFARYKLLPMYKRIWGKKT